MNPAGGAGAMSAMHDAICLANWIYVLPSLSVDDLEGIFEKYQQERYPHAMEAFRSSRMLARGLEKNLGGAMTRYVQTHMPRWLWTIALKRFTAHRPQVVFLKHVQDTGTVPPKAQPSLIQTRILLDKLIKSRAATAVATPAAVV